jgi:hypothetical protein
MRIAGRGITSVLKLNAHRVLTQGGRQLADIFNQRPAEKLFSRINFLI